MKKVYIILAIFFSSLILLEILLFQSAIQNEKYNKQDYWTKNEIPTIIVSIERDYSKSGVLPEKLTDVVYLKQNYDYYTKTITKYEKTGPSSFKLCAKFNTGSSTPSTPSLYGLGDYGKSINFSLPAHSRGNTCFNFDLNNIEIIKFY